MNLYDEKTLRVVNCNAHVRWDQTRRAGGGPSLEIANQHTGGTHGNSQRRARVILD
jgi:hypothetical protein